MNEDLPFKIKSGFVGWPSIVFHRHHEKNVTKIKELNYGSEAKHCKLALGCDANALYLLCMMQEMPTDSLILKSAENNFKPKLSENLVDCLGVIWSMLGIHIEIIFNTCTYNRLKRG